jgi:hypothetical protein
MREARGLLPQAMELLPATTRRVALHTDPSVNERIRLQTAANIDAFRDAPPDVVRARLRELDREWDIERAIEANASLIALGGLALGTFVDRRFLLLPAAVLGFLLQHSLQGWCPPVPVLRRLGFRTEAEIEEERCALRPRE